MSDLFERISDTIMSTGKEVGQKAKEMTEKAKVQYEIRKKEDALRQRFEQIGREYYEEHSESEELVDVSELYDEIDALKEQLAEIRGGKICPDCGKKLAEDAIFCSYCGTALEDPFVDEDEEDQEITNE